MSMVCERPQEGGVRLMWMHVYRGWGSKILLFPCGHQKWMTPYCK